MISRRTEVLVEFALTQRRTGGDGNEDEDCEAAEEAHVVVVGLGMAW